MALGVDDGSHRILRREVTVRVIESRLTTEKGIFTFYFVIYQITTILEALPGENVSCRNAYPYFDVSKPQYNCLRMHLSSVSNTSLLVQKLYAELCLARITF